MNYGGLFQTGNPNAGGWRYGFENRPTSNAALQQVAPIDPEFLKKVAGMKPEEKKGLLDAALTAQPLQGLLDTGGGTTDGVAQAGGGTSGATGIGVGSMSSARDSAAAKAALGGLVKGGGLGILGAINAGGQYMDTVNQTNAGVLGAVNRSMDPIASLNAIQGWTTPDQAYLQALRDAMERGSIGGDGAYGGFGGVTGGSDTMGFGGEY